MLFARLTEQEWYHLFDTVFSCDSASHSEIEDVKETARNIEEIEQNQFGIKITYYETNSHVYEILDKGKFLFACLKVGIQPRIFNEHDIV
jgi:hypothetical protein